MGKSRNFTTRLESTIGSVRSLIMLSGVWSSSASVGSRSGVDESL